MPANYHEPSVNALFDVMPLPVLTFSTNGQVSYANKAAKLHPGKPVEVMGGSQVIRALANGITLGKVKLPYEAEVELNDGLRLKGNFMKGLTGLDIAFVARQVQGAAEGQEPPAGRKSLGEIIGFLSDEVGPPLRKLSVMLGRLPQSRESSQLEEAAQALNQRLARLSDVIAVFGEEVLLSEDRVDLAELVNQVCKDLGSKADAMKMRFEIAEPAHSLPALYGNEKMLRRAFYECFDNAITHSRKEINSKQFVAIKVDFMLTGEHVLITVRNQGSLPEEVIGIETREAFSKSEDKSPGPNNGRLGLPLVQRIIGLFGGNMRMTAVGEDEVRVMMEFPTGAPRRGQAQLDIAQAQRYAADLAQLMSRRRKEK